MGAGGCGSPDTCMQPRHSFIRSPSSVTPSDSLVTLVTGKLLAHSHRHLSSPFHSFLPCSARPRLPFHNLIVSTCQKGRSSRAAIVTCFAHPRIQSAHRRRSRITTWSDGTTSGPQALAQRRAYSQKQVSTAHSTFQTHRPGKGWGGAVPGLPLYCARSFLVPGASGSCPCDITCLVQGLGDTWQTVLDGESIYPAGGSTTMSHWV